MEKETRRPQAGQGLDFKARYPGLLAQFQLVNEAVLRYGTENRAGPGSYRKVRYGGRYGMG